MRGFAARLGTSLVALIALVLGESAAARAGTPVSIQVADQDGHPVVGVLVFAADAESDKIAGVATTDAAGEVHLTVPSRRQNFGVLSPTLGVERLITRGPTSFTLVVHPLPAVAGSGPPDEKATRIRTPHAMVVRGRVIDETGAALAGVRLEAVRTAGAIAAVALAGQDGRFALVLPGGSFALRAVAPGLKTMKVGKEQEQVVVMMTIAVEPQTVQIYAGHVLKFRLEDSIDPEYAPPPTVRAWLAYTYGICPSTQPLTAGEKRGLKKYWYLDVLRREPPNPATVDSSNCVPPGMWEQASSAVTDGFGPLDTGGQRQPLGARDIAAGPP
jgi:hypothetical protein